MPNPRRQDRELDALYAELPTMRCQGFCSDSCGPIGMSVRERARIVERARKPITCQGGNCSMLTEDRRCGVYAIRPLICRLWGLVAKMACPYGCRPEGGFLSDREAMRFMLEADRIGGSPKNGRMEEALKAIADMPEEDLAQLALATLEQGRATLEGRLPTLHRQGVRAPFEQPGIPWGENAMAYRKDSANDQT